MRVRRRLLGAETRRNATRRPLNVETQKNATTRSKSSKESKATTTKSTEEVQEVTESKHQRMQPQCNARLWMCVKSRDMREWEIQDSRFEIPQNETKYEDQVSSTQNENEKGWRTKSKVKSRIYIYPHPRKWKKKESSKKYQKAMHKMHSSQIHGVQRYGGTVI